MAVRNGEQFLEGLRDGREIWLEGERVDDVTAHPKLRRMAHTLAGLYDLQHSPDFHDRMTFVSPTSGEPVSLSFLAPETYEDLVRRRKALEVTAGACFRDAGTDTGLRQHTAYCDAADVPCVRAQRSGVPGEAAGLP